MSQKVKNMISTSDPRVTMIGHPAPAWMVNYADLMTELVCFFIVLYALSAALNKDVQEAKKEVEEQMKSEQVAADVKVTKDGMQITIQETGENVFFASGSADLTPRMTEILGKLGPTLKKLADNEHEIVVEGHTDDIPIHTARFSSNWDLSTARATSVIQHMIRKQEFSPKLMGAIGYGEHRPLVANDSDEHRATNRRVVFFVKNKPPKFDNGEKKEGTKEESAGETAAATAEEAAVVADANAPPAETGEDAPPSEPTAEADLPLPEEAPADSAS
jgi:flagellar motor protein MotB